MGKVNISGAGRVAAPVALPSGYRRIEYIQSTGAQYVNTEFNPSNTTRAIATIEWLSGGAGIVGARSGGTGFILYNEAGQGNTFYTMFGSTYASTGVAAATDGKVVADMNGTTKTVAIGEGSATLTAATFSLSIPLFLFAFNDSGTANLMGSIRMYDCKIYDNGTLVRDFIPCVNAEGVAGLWCNVTKKFYPSASATPFIDFTSLPEVGKDLNEYTWEEIRLISDAGLAADYFSVGDTKSITINGTVGATTFSSLSINAFILGIDHNSAKEGTNKIHFGLGKISGKDVCLCDSYYNTETSTSGAFVMNTSASNSGGWASCHMRKTVLGSDSTAASPTANTLLAALPADLLAVLKPITKYTDNTGSSSNTASYVTATTDYLPLMAEFEVYGTRSYANSAEQNHQAQYDYYKAGNSKVKYKHNATTTSAPYPLRSAYKSSSAYFCRCGSNDSSGGRNANLGQGVAPLFAV